jgi:hypothetical protein
MSNVLLNNNILAIYGLWRSSEIVLLTKRSFNPSVRTNWRSTGECSVLNITLLVGGNAGCFICRAPHFSTVSGNTWSIYNPYPSTFVSIVLTDGIFNCQLYQKQNDFQQFLSHIQNLTLALTWNRAAMPMGAIAPIVIGTGSNKLINNGLLKIHKTNYQRAHELQSWVENCCISILLA